MSDGRAVALLGARAAPLLSIDNPLNGLAYQQARWLQGLGSLIPVPALSSKIADTAGHLLRGNDVAIYRVQPVTGQLGGYRIRDGRSPRAAEGAGPNRQHPATTDRGGAIAHQGTSRPGRSCAPTKT